MAKDKAELEPKKFVVWANPHDDFRYASIYVQDSSGRSFIIPLFNGVKYRQVYGVPRKLWDPRNPEKPLFEAYSIEGEFDAEHIRWKTAKMKVKDLITLEERFIDVEDWPFSLYEGDELYQGDKKVLSSRPPSD
ncbi:MAG: hypothetical protein N3E36_00320 [Sulfolobales archaeon]|nr:hypothetical protein [Sulfolobales archaeon]MCX8198472.1 hypothetical protein [Sulfolobales archaeon]MDW8169546.1 hypothetical protein [Desulfurococcaceae archaeon]